MKPNEISTNMTTYLYTVHCAEDHNAIFKMVSNHHKEPNRLCNLHNYTQFSNWISSWFNSFCLHLESFNIMQLLQLWELIASEPIKNNPVTMHFSKLLKPSLRLEDSTFIFLVQLSGNRLGKGLWAGWTWHLSCYRPLWFTVNTLVNLYIEKKIGMLKYKG